MKLIIAYIRPEKLNAVKQALFDANVIKMSVTNALGCGEEQKYHEDYRGVGFEVDLFKKVRLEIAINNTYLQTTVDAIVNGAKTGNIGDGKIFIMDLAECVRIRTGENGRDAIG